jgi:formylglycine-generating enzyme required for sulfatase activity
MHHLSVPWRLSSLLLLFAVLLMGVKPPAAVWLASEQMVKVKGGDFRMARPEELRDNLNVNQPVVVTDFYISKHEVTFAEYDAFCRATDHAKPPDMGWGRAQRPVVQVSWHDAVAYCNWLSKKANLEPCYEIDGKEVSCNFKAGGFRLPTEAEWSYAARGGHKMTDTKYAGSDNIDKVAWYFDKADDEDEPKMTHPVGQLEPNELGLYDMSGNVWEWTWDHTGSGYFVHGGKVNPTGAKRGKERMVRGGSWFSDAEFCRVDARSAEKPEYSNSNQGFRLVRSVKGEWTQSLKSTRK